MNHSTARRTDRARRVDGLAVGAALVASFALTSCAQLTGFGIGPGIGQSNYPSATTTPADFDAALKENLAAQKEGKLAPDTALYNTGVILAHPSNPKADRARALVSFRTLIAEHPRSGLAAPAQTWVQVLEQQRKLNEQKQKMAEEKRALAREREALLQERQKLNYANEKSRQIDLDIERRRRQSLSK